MKCSICLKIFPFDPDTVLSHAITEHFDTADGMDYNDLILCSTWQEIEMIGYNYLEKVRREASLPKPDLIDRFWIWWHNQRRSSEK